MTANRTQARQAIDEAHELLGRADAAIQRLGAELRGEPGELAARLSRHIRFMREVAELLAHEMERSPLATLPGSGPLPDPGCDSDPDFRRRALRLVSGARRD